VQVLVETGDFSGEPDEAGRIKTENLLEGMQRLGYDVINLGERELAGGVAQFRELTGKLKLAFINANFVYRDNGESLFAPYVIREYKTASGRSLKVGFLGLDALNTAFTKEAPGGRAVVMRDPVDAAKMHVPALRPRVDLLVLLANLSLRDLTTVLSSVKGVDLALVSYGARLSESGKLESLSGVPVLYSGDQGKRMGEVRLSLGKKAAPPAMQSHQIFLTRRYPSEPAMQALVDKAILRVNEVNKQAAERLAAAAPASTPAPLIIAPSNRTGGGPGIYAPPGQGIVPGAGASSPYATAATCETCHAQEYEVYRNSGHAHALDTLTKANQDFNAECVKCHVTGFDQPNGFVNAKQTPDLANVQCEACHGNGSAHLADLTKPFGRVPPRTCFTCHTKENSPDFVFYKYWDKIKH